jgi:hypothetical protein
VAITRTRNTGPLSSSHLVRGRAYVGDKVEIKVLREGKEVVLTSELARKQPGDHLVLPYLFDRGPRYVLMGGCCSRNCHGPTSTRLARSSAAGRSSASHASPRIPTSMRRKAQEARLPQPRAAHAERPRGYDRLGGQVVNKVNGKASTASMTSRTPSKTRRTRCMSSNSTSFPTCSTSTPSTRNATTCACSMRLPHRQFEAAGVTTRSRSHFATPTSA